jgi:hypothetical protein
MCLRLRSLSREAAEVDDLVVDGLEQAFLLGAMRVLDRQLGDRPLDVAGGDHRLQLAEIGRARIDDPDAELLFVRFEEGLAQRGRLRAARRVDDDARGLRRRSLSESLRRDGERSRSGQDAAPRDPIHAHESLPLALPSASQRLDYPAERTVKPA